MTSAAIPIIEAAVMEALTRPVLATDLAVFEGTPEALPEATAGLYMLGGANAQETASGAGVVVTFDLRFLLEVHGLADQAAVKGRLWEILAEVKDRLTRARLGSAAAVLSRYFVVREWESGFVGGVWLARARPVLTIRARTGR